MDPKKRTVRLVDMAKLPENAAVLREVNRIKEPHINSKEVPWNESYIENPTPTEIKTALWEMHCWLKDEKAVLVHGRMPSCDEILSMEGDLQVRTGEILRRIPRPDGGFRVETKYASEEEIEKLRTPAQQRIRTVPVAE